MFEEAGKRGGIRGEGYSWQSAVIVNWVCWCYTFQPNSLSPTQDIQHRIDLILGVIYQSASLSYKYAILQE